MSSILRRVLHTAFNRPYSKPTHSCGELNATHAGSNVVLAGCILPERKISNRLSFFPIKDFSGTTQLVVRRDNHDQPVLSSLSRVPVESSVLINGRVSVRPTKDRRPSPTGDVEVHVDSFTVLNPAAPVLPFYPSDDQAIVNDELRARFRYLDLRRTALANNIRQRSHVSRLVRDALHTEGFLEVETPLLLKSSPEGAREFLVPSRLSQSDTPLFYSLPQSPQQPKQLLICSGAIDKYFQFAKCFRDEDGRKDRQPEFTQIDLEMAYVAWGPHPNAHNNPWRIGGHEVRAVIESLMGNIWHNVQGIRLPSSFNVITYAEAMARYGSDKPDTRFALEIQNITSLLPHHHQSSLANLGQVLETLAIRRSENLPFVRADDQYQLTDEPTVTRIVLTSTNLLTWLCNLVSPAVDPEHHISLNNVLKVNVGDTLYVSRRHAAPKGGATPLGRIRTQLAESAQNLGVSDVILIVSWLPHLVPGDYVPPAYPHLFTHHPFTAPMWQDITAMYDGRIDEVRGQHYDLVLNGTEIGGGSVRVHDAAMQEYVFSQVLQLDESEKASFDHLLQALKCGAPPHGGIALGFDRLMSILCNTQSIRDVIAFPKTGAGTDPLFKSPATVTNDVLSQYGIQGIRT
ncbi:tRNA synthetases class II-domain-containing protein [Boletus reticuloceps]|uniref:tRNA synthetases class II-domain-containing protein n=1 Tax=Boletus reticuloceps TaxID=495285 RepID=A0A8I2YSS3_9AGAM|nr:tRNA synthetases class II-domain-containing protein [Boletus reticuloceps]